MIARLLVPLYIVHVGHIWLVSDCALWTFNQARKLVNLLCKMGIALGATIGAFSSALLIGAPTIFTIDKMIISELAGASMPLFLALTVTSVNIAMARPPHYHSIVPLCHLHAYCIFHNGFLF